MSQDAPIPNDREFAQDRAIRELTERRDYGVNLYGTGVQIGNGRRMSKDYREEIQDALVYATGLEMMDEELIKILTHIRDMHSADDLLEDNCTVCLTTLPCHTRVDIEHALELLGVKNTPPTV